MEDELWARIFFIAAALLVATLVVAIRRRLAASAPRSLAATGLDPGVYLFTSGDCVECSLARAKLESSIGAGGYDEIAWEERPEIFERLSVDAVPATMIVAADGSARLWPGQPDPVPLGH